jgi:hypothetical protein
MTTAEQHSWTEDEGDGVGNAILKCQRGTCTVRKVENCSTFWQRAKGGHWRDTENEEIPPCTGRPVGRRSRNKR